ncbi:hypothetical protein H7J06_09405 [Mycobacterium hodleri]|uniref:hypothetical protein n=1 Tax=Mycolicibacterium hodleri TaxID=49897 RepID=UPI0021F31A3E|nr:hypothetical protein [Mycolicibacterium hodleri]MCV7133205.1 hypothetical protein [Mycolicibacterium hodleri]
MASVTAYAESAQLPVISRAMSLAAIGANWLPAAIGDFDKGWTFVVLQHTD